MGTWTTPNNRSSISFGGFTFNIGDARNAGYNPFQPQNIPFGVLRGLARMNQMRNPFGSGNPLAIGTPGEDTYIDNSFAQASDQTRASCAAMGQGFDSVLQVCIPKTSSDGIGGAVGQAAEKAEDILTTVVGGISSVTGIDGLIDKAGEGIAEVVGGIVGTLVPGFDADVVINPTGGVSATVTAPNTKKNPNTTQSGVTVGSTSNTQGGTTTVSVDAGDIGNLVLGGGRIADAVDIITGEGTEGGYTQSDLILQAACVAQGKEYDYTSGMCVEKSNKQKPPAPGGSAVNPGGGDTSSSGGNTTVTVGGKTDAELCAQTGYAIANAAKCRPFWEQCSDGKWAIKGTCPDPTTTITGTDTTTDKAAICPDNTDKKGQTIPDGQTVAWCTNAATTITGTDTTTDKAAICPDNTDKKGQTIPDGQTVAWCTNAATTTTTTTTDKAAICPDNTDKAKQEIPAGETVAWCTTTTTTTDTGTGKAAICPDGTDKAKQEIPAGQTVAWCTTTTTDTGTDKAAICPDGTDKANREIPAGQTVAWCTEAGGVDPKCDEVRAECAKLGKAMKDDCSGCVDTVVAGGGTSSGGGSSLPSFIPRSALNVIKQDKPDVVEIDYLYDIGGESIFAPDIQRAAIDGNPYATRAKKGGIIGNANTVDQIISLLGEK